MTSARPLLRVLASALAVQLWVATCRLRYTPALSIHAVIKPLGHFSRDCVPPNLKLQTQDACGADAKIAVGDLLNRPCEPNMQPTCTAWACKICRSVAPKGGSVMMSHCCPYKLHNSVGRKVTLREGLRRCKQRLEQYCGTPRQRRCPAESLVALAGVERLWTSLKSA